MRFKFIQSPRFYAHLIYRRTKLFKKHGRVIAPRNHPVLAKLFPQIKDRELKEDKLAKVMRQNRRQIQTHFPWMLSDRFTRKRKRLAGRNHVAKWIHPERRVMFHNIEVGDQVRLRHGPRRMRYEDPDPATVQAERIEGDQVIKPPKVFKIWKVASIQKWKNRVFLEGLEHDRTSILPLDRFEQPLPGTPPFTKTRKVSISVGYANLQLLIPTETFIPLAKEHGVTPVTVEGPNGEKKVTIPGLPDQVFASRLVFDKVKGPHQHDKAHFWEQPEDRERLAYGLPRKWTWRRMAAATYPKLLPQFRGACLDVAWPKVEIPTPPAITQLDTPAQTVTKKTWLPPSREDILSASGSSNIIPDMYLENRTHSLPMEIYVSKELANPYARLKLEKAKKARIAARAIELEGLIEEAVLAWRLREDRVRLGLEPRVGRRMKEEEVALTAKRRFAELQVENIRIEQVKFEQRMREKHGPSKTELKIERRAKAKAQVADALRKITLLPGRNQVIPAGAEKVV